MAKNKIKTEHFSMCFTEIESLNPLRIMHIYLRTLNEEVFRFWIELQQRRQSKFLLFGFLYGPAFAIPTHIYIERERE